MELVARFKDQTTEKYRLTGCRSHFAVDHFLSYVVFPFSGGPAMV